MLNEISNYFDICIEGIIKTITLPIGIFKIMIKYLIKKGKWWNMTLEETQDKEDILILMMIDERDKQIELLETENTGFRNLTADLLLENKRLKKVIKELRSKRNRRYEWIEKTLKITNTIKYG